MLPSRGLWPAQFTHSALRQPIARSQTSRQFSSIHRASVSSVSCSRTLQGARWRAGISRHQNVILSASAVRHGSWYAPWSWGKSSTPGAPPTEVPVAEFSNDHITHAADHIEPAATTASTVSTATPELAPAGIDKAAIVDGSQSTLPADGSMSSFMQDSLRTPEELQLMNPTTEIDPTRLVDHPGHLYEMGLDYGYGMTTMFEKTIESIYLTSGWGWAGSIVAAGVGVRLILFGFQAMSSNQMATMRALQPVTKPIQEKMEAAIARGDKAQADLYKMQQQEIMKPFVGGFASMGGFMIVQAWIGFSAFRFLRAMSTMPVPGMSQDGILWFTDLTLRDPYFILPAATSGIMYVVFKTGGETGVQAGQNAEMRTKLFTGLAVLMGLVTAFQPAALQIYFFTSAILGGCTGYLLRQNGFRRLVGIRELPSKESNALFSRVAAGELKLKDIQGPDGKIRYQPPSTPSQPKTLNVKPSNVRTATTLSGIRVKAGTQIPLHLKAEAPKRETALVDRDFDYDEGTAGKSIGEKLSYYRRNYKWSFVSRRMQASMENMARKAGYGGAKVSPEQERRRRRAEEYEIERKRRFENRS